ncbi:regulator [Vibrio fluvialis]|uniref:regulator n=1 Tax=Vibrio fluvialis TaxID=676 RepID=UPI0013028D7C|nr:regulator [Vibrio fluvialis]EKO3980868.1 regulator [Vibrio fluvialis]
MKYHEMSKNYIFREFECGLTREQTAELCFKSVRTVTEWDRGKPIPPECKRLMRMFNGKELSYLPIWDGFRISNGKLQLPNGKFVSPQEIIIGIALLEIGADLENKIKSEVLKYARLIAKLKP